LSYQSGWEKQWDVPTKGAISLARSRLGEEPLQECFHRGCAPLAKQATPGAFWRGLRLMSIDGTTLDVPDTAVNDEAFGRPRSPRGEGSAFPQVRLVGLAESGAHAHIDVAIGGRHDGENTLAQQLVGQFKRSRHGGNGVQRGRALVAEASAALSVDDRSGMVGFGLIDQTKANAPWEPEPPGSVEVLQLTTLPLLPGQSRCASNAMKWHRLAGCNRGYPGRHADQSSIGRITTGCAGHRTRP
jgi:hypothetical protein